MSYQLIPTRTAVPATFNWLLDRMLTDFRADRVLAPLAPSVDITEDANNYYVALAAPGLTKAAFKLELSERTLRISGERNFERKEDTRYHLVESGYGAFQRSFRLPDNIRREAISATYTDGILTVTLPKDEARPLVQEVPVQ